MLQSTLLLSDACSVAPFESPLKTTFSLDVYTFLLQHTQNPKQITYMYKVVKYTYFYYGCDY